MLNESQIRDLLASQLSLLEEGLTLVKTEFELPNPFGSKGFIDILARDRFGHRVIIELKRSDQAARQALHEIFKYAALFVANQGLPLSRIRCFVVSTEWRELLVPFTEFKSSSDLQAEGFQLYLSGDLIDRADRVVLPELPTHAKLFQQHGIFLFGEKLDRDNAATQVETSFIEAGANSYLLVLVDYSGQNDGVVYPYGIYAVPIKLDAARELELWKIVKEEYSDEDEYSQSDMESFFEDSFLATVSERTRRFNETTYTYEIGYPEKFTRMLDSGWQPTRLLRHGQIGEAAADESELLRLIAGVEGQSEIRFNRISSPRFQLAWSEMLKESARSLEGNIHWQMGFNWFCKFVGSEYKGSNVSVSVYNPLVLPISLFKLASVGDARYLPQMELVSTSEDMRTCDVVHGVLMWDGKTIPNSFNEMMIEVCDGAFEYLSAMNLGIAWDFDNELMQRHGLRYGLLRCQIRESGMRAEMMEVNEDGPRFFPLVDTQYVPMQNFLDSADAYLSELVAELRELQFGM